MIFVFFLLPSIAFAQAMYKCPNASGVVNFQQMPCTPTGGGEMVPVKVIPSGAGSGLSGAGMEYLAGRDKFRAEQAEKEDEEQRRQEELGIERSKARAAYRQARAQEDTASALRESNRLAKQSNLRNSKSRSSSNSSSSSSSSSSGRNSSSSSSRSSTSRASSSRSSSRISSSGVSSKK